MHTTNLLQVLMITEGPQFTESCVLGLKVCSDETACPLHNEWAPVKKKIITMLTQSTLEDLARSVLTGKYRLADIPVSFISALP
jgi:DNA-binding IscR family transcriptional regulator